MARRVGSLHCYFTDDLIAVSTISGASPQIDGGLMKGVKRCILRTILLDMNLCRRMTKNLRHGIEDRGDKVVDLHIWRVDPGHMSAVVSVATDETERDSRFYHAVLGRFKGLSHVTVEVQASQAA
jgi:Co/Zn/Cd efflux system component